MANNHLTQISPLLTALNGLQKLESLRIDGNPVIELFPNVRENIIAKVPSLKSIDGVNVGIIDEALMVYQRQMSLIDNLY